MFKKRLHNKSRYGCDQCRTRRVKCDERLPQCTACDNRGISCVYSRVTPWAQAEHPIPVLSTSPDATPRPNQGKLVTYHPATRISVINQPSSDTGRFRELELMHQWHVRTSICDSIDMSVWQDHVGKEALQHGFLMDSLFALTSVHIASDTNDIARFNNYMQATLQYQNRAIAGLRDALQNVSQANCHAISISSTFIMISTFVNLLFSAQHETSATKALDIIPTTADFVKGIWTVVHTSGHWLQGGPLEVMTKERKVVHATPSWTEFMISELKALNNSTSNEEQHPIFESAISQLEKFIQRGVSVIPWLITAGRKFMNELKSDNNVAIAIVMHWGVVLEKFSNTWWEGYSGIRVVDEFSSKLMYRGERWQPPLAWCRMQVGLEHQ